MARREGRKPKGFGAKVPAAPSALPSDAASDDQEALISFKFAASAGGNYCLSALGKDELKAAMRSLRLFSRMTWAGLDGRGDAAG